MYTLARWAKFPGISTLDISHALGISGRLFVLVSYNLPALNTLILSNCRLIAKDLKSLAKAHNENKLPSLRHLDISGNLFLCHHDALSLFEYQAKWESLLTLCVQGSSPDWWACLGSKVQAGCLGSLLELKVKGSEWENQFFLWQSLRKLHIYGYENEYESQAFLAQIRNLVQNGMFPNLDTVLVSLYSSKHMAPESECDVKNDLMSLGIYVRMESGVPWPNFHRRSDDIEIEKTELHSSKSTVSAQSKGRYICLNLVGY